MRALSIRQPWAHLVATGSKPIENRTWSTPYRGLVLIHASLGTSRVEHREATGFALSLGVHVPQADDLSRAGFVGVANLVDVLAPWESAALAAKRIGAPRSWLDWWQRDGHCYGFVFRDARPAPFSPYKGKLGLFNVPDNLVIT